uniref:Fibronectin type-III domain-containing protein n=1 Tax=Timema cristinae TaxID=61476 RepID=A0A7R9DDY2_TIMCR|nr:unnamed protein product [Timema cristinae]
MDAEGNPIGQCDRRILRWFVERMSVELVTQIYEVPEQVTGLEVTGSSISTITIQWRTPSNTECLQGYLVCWSLVDGDENGCVTQTRHEHATRNLTGLTQCGRYSISVTVVSSSNDYSEATNTTAFSNPPLRRVSNVRALETSSTSFLVEWDLLTEDTECLEDYAMCWEMTGTFLNNCSSHPLDLTPAMNFTGLENCANYTFTVTARDESGESVANTIWAILSLTPGNVSSLETSSVGPSVLATWTPPSYRPRCVMQYEICWGSSPGNQTCAVQESSVTTFEITELTPCSEYVVGVRALGKPDNSSQWRVPTVNYECVQRYIVCWRSSRDRTEGCLNTTNLEQVITGLTPCVNYSINITAVGAIGISRASQMSAHTRSQDGCVTQTRATKRAPIPGLMSCVNYIVDVTTGDILGDSNTRAAPVVMDTTLTQDKPAIQNLSLSRDSEGNITVTWHPLVEGMMCVRSYNVCWEKQSQPEDNQCLELPSSENHLTISGLHSGATYTVEVSAVLVTGETSEIIREDIPISATVPVWPRRLYTPKGGPVRGKTGRFSAHVLWSEEGHVYTDNAKENRLIWPTATDSRFIYYR